MDESDWTAAGTILPEGWVLSAVSRVEPREGYAPVWYCEARRVDRWNNVTGHHGPTIRGAIEALALVLTVFAKEHA